MKVSFGLMLLVLTVAALTQKPSPAQLQEMQKLDFLVGEWKGEGWELTPDGERGNSFSCKAKVQSKAGDGKLRVQGSREYKPGKGMIRSSTLDASITYDETSKLYHWRGKYSSKPIEAKLVSDQMLQYGMPFSIQIEPEEGFRKTTIRITQTGVWEETLEVWSKGKWYKVEQSLLTRVK